MEKMEKEIVIVEKHKKKKKKKSSSQNIDVLIPRPLFEKLNKIFRFKRWGTPTSTSQVAGAVFAGNLQFTLNAVNGYTEFTGLFDSYRIAFVEVIFTPRFNFGAVNAVGNNLYPKLYTVIDLDDASAPASIAVLLEYGTCRKTNYDQAITRRIKPFATKAVYNGSTPFSGYSMANDWMDCDYPDIRYYGLKYAIEAGQVGQTNLQTWSIDFIYYIECKFIR